jgi:hypothetical protein
MSTSAPATPATGAPPKKRFSIGKILLIILGLVVGALALFLVFVATKPDDFQVTRSATINAPPETVFKHINDLRKWEPWNPWGPLDPNVKYTYSGPDAGEGAQVHWSGNNKVGEGEMTILESRSPKYLQIKLHFIRPFEDSSIVDFAVEPTDKIMQSTVTWKMTGKHPSFFSKAFCTAMNMEGMLGKNFDDGLAGIKRIAEEETGPVP